MERSDVAQTETNGQEVLETREWVDSLDYVLSQGGPVRAGRLLQQLALQARRASQSSVLCDHSLPEHDRCAAAGAIPWQPGNGTPHQESGALERAGDGSAR